MIAYKQYFTFLGPKLTQNIQDSANEYEFESSVLNNSSFTETFLKEERHIITIFTNYILYRQTNFVRAQYSKAVVCYINHKSEVTGNAR